MTHHHRTEKTAALLGGALLGVAAMYLLDPDQGRKRRAAIKSHAGEYIGNAGDVLHKGLERVSAQAHDVGHTIADKAEAYGHRLSNLANEYSQRLTEHAQEVGAWSDQAKDAASHVSDSVGGLRDQGRKLWNRYTGKAHQYADQAGDEMSEYGNRLWGKVRALGGKAHSRAESAVGKARSFGQEDHSSAIVPAAITAVGCCAMGAGIMYLMDSERGAARRTWLMNNISQCARAAGMSMYHTGMRVADRVSGKAGNSGENGSTDSTARSPKDVSSVPIL